MFKNGKKINCRYLQFYYAESGSRKVGFIVGKKVSKSAVERNKVKRMLRALFRKFKPNLPERVCVIIIAFPSIIRGTFDEICEDYKVAADKICSVYH